MLGLIARVRRAKEKSRPRSRAEEIRRNFLRFHRANPEVWKLFKRFTLQTMTAGHKYYSADAVVHRIRWHTSVEVHTDEEFKINDHYVSYYARLFMKVYPEHKGFFRIRRRTSTQRRAKGGP